MPISQATRKILWARSGNLCVLCRRALVEEGTEYDDRAVVGEECHIYAQGKTGPRGQGQAPADVHHYSNLILLCGACHTVIDAQEATYTVELLMALRDQHETWVAQRLSTAGNANHPENEGNGWADAEALSSDTESDQLFAGRLAEAFPGARGLTVIPDPTAAIERLLVVLRHPLRQWHWDADKTRRPSYPFWWFRGSLCLHIPTCRRLDDTHCLLDTKELKIRRVAAFRRSYTSMWDFLYVESDPDHPTGLYDYGADPSGAWASCSMGFYFEEYAIWNGMPISRDDYDDGATLVDGHPTRVSSAELRLRYLTSYNFLVCANRHVINEPAHDTAISALLDGILNRTRTLEELASFVDSLPKPARFYSEWD